MTVRLAAIVVSSGVMLAACGPPAREGVADMDIEKHLISLERSALDRWIHADPDGYLGLYTQDATYFDPFREKRADGRAELEAQVASIRGVALPFTEPRYDMINPVVQAEGSTAVLTFNLVNYGKPTGKAEEVVLARWNATEVYRKLDGTWKLIHTHWSFTQPQLAPPAASR